MTGVITWLMWVSSTPFSFHDALPAQTLQRGHSSVADRILLHMIQIQSPVSPDLAEKNSYLKTKKVTVI